jgi:TolB-like protein/DNA-binding winged helix-turn-helix (wHTH) protein
LEGAVVWLGKRNGTKSSEIRLGGLWLDPATGRLSDATGTELELRHQSQRVLARLAERPGETVTRDALIESVWSGRAVSSDSVSQCIADIRRALGAEGKDAIETVPREGYRLVPQDASRPILPGAVLALAAFTLAALAISGMRPGAATPPPVVAVLPFTDHSVGPHRGVLDDVVGDTLATALARNPRMTVISRRSSMQFRDSDLRMGEIAAQLGADYVVEGSQLFDGDRIRISTRLVDGRSEASVWAGEMDVRLGALLEANDEIVGKIASAVGLSLVDVSAARMSEGDVSALLVSNAAQSRIMRDFTRENLLINLREQEEAIRDFPDSAWGHLGQALALRVGMRHGWIEGDEDATRARMVALARRAVALDPNNFMAHHALGRVLMFNRDVPAAIGAFRRGAELNPSSTLVLVGLADALVFVGDTEGALEVVAQVERIDPLYGFSVAWTKAVALWQAGECEAALDVFRATPTLPVAAHKDLAAIHHCLGDIAEGAEVMKTYRAQNPGYTLARIKADETGMWTAPGVLERWLAAMEAVGVPSE